MKRTYGHRAGPDEPVELVTIQVVGQGIRAGSGIPETRALEPTGTAAAPASAGLLRTGTDWVQTPVIRRSDLSSPLAGPVIVEEYDATCVIPPARVPSSIAGGNILIELM